MRILRRKWLKCPDLRRDLEPVVRGDAFRATMSASSRARDARSSARISASCLSLSCSFLAASLASACSAIPLLSHSCLEASLENYISQA